MDTKVDMTYSFLWDEEPTDEQLEQLMIEVAEEARRKKEVALKRLKAEMQLEATRLRVKRQAQKMSNEKA